MDLPEYAATVSPMDRRTSLQSSDSIGGRTSSLSRSSSRLRTHHDPNTVVLERFEDASPISASPFMMPPPSRRPSLPDSMHHLALTTPPPSNAIATPVAPVISASQSEDSGIARFRNHVLRLLVQPQANEAAYGVLLLGSTWDNFDVEASRFPPVCFTCTHLWTAT